MGIFKKDYNKHLEGEWLTREQIGLFLFTQKDLLSEKYKLMILDLIKEMEELIKPEKLDLIRAGSDKNYFINLSEKNFQNFKKDFLSFKYERNSDKGIFNLGYEIDLKKGCGKNNTIGDIRLCINIDGLINDKSFRPDLKQGRGNHRISVFIPLDFKRINELIDFLKRQFLKLDCVYGYINPVISFNIVPLESRWVLEKYAQEREGTFDIPDNDANNVYYENKVKGTQWGNFINKNHILELGGVRKIKELLPDFIIEDISDNLYMQMPIPLSASKKEMVLYHRKLAKCFKPVYMPEWHSPRFGLGITRDGESKGTIFLKRFLPKEEDS